MKNKNFAYALLGLNVLAAWASWWTLGNSIFGRVSGYDWLIPAAAISIWAIIFTLGAIFIKSRLYFYSSIVLGALGYLFLNSFNLSFIGVVLGVLILFATEYGVKRELERGVQLNFYYVVRQSLKYFVTAVSLVVAVSYFFSLDRDNADLGKIERDSLASQVEWGLKASRYVLAGENKQLVDNILSGATVDEYLRRDDGNLGVSSQDLEMIGQSGVSFENQVVLESLGSSLNQQIRQQALEKSKKEISDQLGMEISGDEQIKDVLAEYADKSQQDFLARSTGVRENLPLIMAIVLFLTVRILATILDLFLGVVIFGFIRVFQTAGIVDIRKEMKEAAAIQYSI